MNRWFLLVCGWLAAASCYLAGSVGEAVQLEFQLQGPNSLLAAPFSEFLNMPLGGQGPGSLTTTHSGTITVDVDDVMNPTSITFVSASAVAANSGDWLPQEGGGDAGDPNVGGDANPGTRMPANYGFEIEIPDFLHFYGASRDNILSFNSPALAVSSSQFDLTTIGIAVVQGWFDANLSTAGVPEEEGATRLDLADPEDPTTGTNCTDHLNPGSNSCGTDMGSYSVAGDTATLTLPLNFHIGGGDPVVQFTGTFTATASLIEELQGDYNDDGTVNAADYTVWRDGGSPDSTQAGYDLWKANFGNSGSGSANSTTGAAVPEPTGLVLCVVGMLGIWMGRRAMK